LAVLRSETDAASILLLSAGWSWRLELECCERKILLPGWWLEAGAGGM